MELLQSQRLLWIEDDVCGIIQYIDEQRNDGDIVGAGTITAEVVVEREFGNGSFLEMYSGYVSKKIIELLELEKENNAEDSSE